MVSAPAIRTCSLTKWYGRSLGVDSVSFDVQPGETVGFLGPNGSGKTTVMRMLMGLISPSTGNAEIFGADVATSRSTVRAAIGYLPGTLGLYGTMTARQYFSFLGRMRRADCMARADSLSARLALDTGTRISDMSKGTRQKVGVVQAFMHSPRVLVLDEPTSGLDPLVQHEFDGILREACAEGAAVLLSSHVLAEVERLAHRVAILDAGRLVAFDDVANLPGRASRMVTLEFDGPADPARLAGVPGFTLLSCSGRHITGTVTGSQRPMLEAALRGGLVTVTSPERPLDELFRGLVGRGGLRS
jgi:ABC-2 type transport system ATP-binding protein